MKALGAMAWGLHAPSPPARDPAHAVVAAAVGTEFTLYGCSQRGLELIGREQGPRTGEGLDSLVRRLEDCDLVLGGEGVAGLRARLERVGVAVRPLAAGERCGAVLAAWQAWRGEVPSSATASLVATATVAQRS